MSIAIVILSNEQGKQTIASIGATQAEVNEVCAQVKPSNGAKGYYFTPDNPQALQFLSRAFELIGDKWENQQARPASEATPNEAPPKEPQSTTPQRSLEDYFM